MQRFLIRILVIGGIVVAAVVAALAGAPAGRDLTAEAAIAHPVVLAAGGAHACFVRSDGTVWCWGDNADGQIGDGTTTQRPMPVQVPGLTNVSSITAGNHHTCALLATGTAMCWGRNSSGQLGDGTTTQRLSPVPVCLVGSGGACPPLTGIVSIVAGDIHNCAQLYTGTVMCWGSNLGGQLGDGTTTDSSLPVPAPMPFGYNATQIAAGGATSCAALTFGEVACWGRNTYGEIGDGTTTDRPNATLISTSGLTTDVAVGDFHTCALGVQGNVQCWGLNANGQLGDGGACGAACSTPQNVSGLPVAGSISAGGAQSCAISSGSLLCWGRNQYGELGDGSTVDRTTPTSVGLFTSLVTTGSYATCVIRQDVYCAGRNDLGQLGASSAETCGGVACSTTWVIVLLGHVQPMEIGAGFQSTCVLLSDTSVRCWGRGDFGQLGNGTFTDSLSPVPVCGSGSGPTCAGGSPFLGAVKLGVGRYHTCVTVVAPAVYCWGLNDSGQLGDLTTTDRASPTIVNGVGGGTDVSAGNSHSCARAPLGRNYCWGLNATGQLGDGTTTNRLAAVWVCSSGTWNTCGPFSLFTQVAAGSAHTCAIDGNAEAECWGWNSFGQLGDGTLADRANQAGVCASGSGGACPRLERIVDIEAGDYAHTCAAVLDGTAYCWGLNDNGQLGNGTTTDSALPVAVTGIGGVRQVAAGYAHSCALLSNGTVWCWGDDAYGQLGNDAAFADSSTPVMALGINSAIAIAAGALHTCALRSDGTVRCWGRNDFGQLGNGTTIDSGVPAVSGIDSDDDGCTDMEELGPNQSLGGQRDEFDGWDFYDVGSSRGGIGPGDENFTKDKKVGFPDTLIILDHFGHNGVDPHDHEMDRKIPDATKPWRTAEETVGGDNVTFTDVLNSLKSFGHDCSGPPN